MHCLLIPRSRIYFCKISDCSNKFYTVDVLTIRHCDILVDAKERVLCQGPRFSPPRTQASSSPPPDPQQSQRRWFGKDRVTSFALLRFCGNFDLQRWIMNMVVIIIIWPSEMDYDYDCYYYYYLTFRDGLWLWLLLLLLFDLQRWIMIIIVITQSLRLCNSVEGRRLINYVITSWIFISH